MLVEAGVAGASATLQFYHVLPHSAWSLRHK